MINEKRIIYLLLIIITVLEGVFLVVSVESAGQTIEYALLTQRVQEWKAKNGDLRHQVAEEQALWKIEEKARAMGFIDAKYVYF